MPWIHKYRAPEIECTVTQWDSHAETEITWDVYRTYLDNDAGLPSAWFFTLDRRERPRYSFDIRRFPTYHSDKTPGQVLQDAVAGGWVEFDGLSFWCMVDGEYRQWKVTA